MLALTIAAFVSLSLSGPGQPSVVLQNAADANVAMPLAGLGMPCGPTYACSIDAYQATKTFLALGGRRTDSADSYAGAEPGIGRAMREWMVGGGSPRSDLFIVSKAGPGGACFPMGYNESIQQARTIIDYYNQVSVQGSANITQLDLLLVHWPVNYGPCGPLPKGATIPTTDVLCDNALPTYDEAGCRLSTWRGMLQAHRMGLTRAVGVSNFNSSEMQALADAGLPLPAVNQVNWQPGFLDVSKPAVNPYPVAGAGGETWGGLLVWCQEHGVLLNGYSPFGGRGSTKWFNQTDIVAVAAAHNISTAQAILRWNVQLGVAVNPMATNPAYQAENLDLFNFGNLTEVEMWRIGVAATAPTE